MNFSKRTDWDAEESELARAHRERLASGLPIADLTASNPTRCGFEYPAGLLALLADPRAFDYSPDPKGSLPARQAVCDYYADHGARVDPEKVLLTTSTSEAYGYLFKLLCDPGDAILIAQPSYPLFDFLATAEAVELTAAPLVYDHGWQLDLEGLKRQTTGQRTGQITGLITGQITSKTRAVVLVHPNNPTGHFTKLAESQALAEVCREHGLALIVDEVFLDFALGGEESSLDIQSFVSRELDIPVFVVSGISKICGLPQMKAAWIAAVGPSSDAAMQRLEILADIYLSMNAPVQLALPVWLAERAGLQGQIRQRVIANLAELDRALSLRAPEDRLANRLKVEGGWYAVLRIPATQSDIVTARELLDLGVWVHPGFFFGMAASGWLVLSLLGKPAEFARGISILLAYLHRRPSSS